MLVQTRLAHIENFGTRSLKALSALAIFMLIVFPIMGQTAPSAASKPKAGQKHTPTVTQAPRAPAVQPVTTPLPPTAIQPVKIASLPTVSTEPKRDWLDILTVVVAVLVLIVGGVGVQYAKKTLAQIAVQTTRLGEHAKHLERLAEAAKDNAAAAAANADSVKRSTELMAITERAWIVEELSFPHGPLPFMQDNVVLNARILTVGFELRNGGKSAAKILSVALRFHAIQNVSLLPPEPFYEGASQAQSLAGDGVMLMPIAATKVPTAFVAIYENGGHFLTRQDALDINDGEAELVVYGRVEYQSLQEKHVNQFCYVWYKGRGIESDPPRFRKGGPFKYNSHT